jgi:ABC-type enterochelin transport system substrate-binding protein
MFMKRIFIATAALLTVLLLPSCAVTTAPTEASSDTFGNTTDATSDLTSSTSKGDDEIETSPDVAAESFVRTNSSQLRTDMAAGGGEYLTTFAILLNVDEAKRADFYSLAKIEFNQVFVSSNTTPEEVVANTRKVIGEAGI